MAFLDVVSSATRFEHMFNLPKKVEKCLEPPSLFQQRVKRIGEIALFILLTAFSFGLLGVYWIYQAKEKMNQEGKDSLERCRLSDNKEKRKARLNATIEKIKVCKEQGLKIGLIIGRTVSEPVPSEDGWFWASLDVLETSRPQLLNDYSFEERSEIDHLIVNISNEKRREKLTELFDKVVVDWSTFGLACADMENPWRELKNLLVHSQESELVTELYNECGEYTYRNEAVKVQKYLQVDRGMILKKRSDLNRFVVTNKDSAAPYAFLIVKLYNMLSRDFESVSLWYQNHPYREAYEEGRNDMNYLWILKSPKFDGS